jgi:hypothetical protein
MVLRTGGYAAKVWDLSIVQGPFSVAPCPTLTSRFATFASLYPTGLQAVAERDAVRRKEAQRRSEEKAAEKLERETQAAEARAAQQAQRLLDVGEPWVMRLKGSVRAERIAGGGASVAVEARR